MRRKNFHAATGHLTTNQRQAVAACAARLLAENHAPDFSTAKRKAAQQLGMPETASLPSNQEVEDALVLHWALFEPKHETQLRELRQKSLYLMRFFAEFSPYLTGSVLSGIAGQHSDINIILYQDDAKAIEFFLINQKIEYQYQKVTELQHHDNYPTLAFWFDETPVKLHVRPHSAERNHARSEPRASQSDVEKLLCMPITV